jgi:dolichol-phosphate mannosyltransferase
MMSIAPLKRVDIVIPVHNEGENIVSLIQALEREVTTPFRALICYDRDDDTTLPVLRSIRPRFEIIPVRNERTGVHGAVTTGFRTSDASAVISYMADDDYNLGLIDDMVDLFRRGYDVVCPSRFIPGGSMVGCRWQKALLVRLVALSLNQVGRLPVHDPTNAFRLISRRLLQQVTIESTQGFTYSLELLAKCHRLGLGIAELPAQWFERKKGRSHFRILGWSPAYLRWYFYIFETTYLRRKTV